MKSEKIKTKAQVLAICVLILSAMSAVCLASTTTYSVPIGTGAADLADDNLASAYSREFATGYTSSVEGWSEDIRLTTDSADSKYPAIAVDTNNNVHITWEDNRDWNGEIYYTKLDNNGTTLVDDTRLTSDSAWPSYPEIAVDTNNNVHITWLDYRDGNWEIYYTKLDNNGTTLVDDTRLTTDSAGSKDPEIAVDTNNNVHITWYNYRDGNYEIYYTKLDNNGTTLVDDTRLTSDSAWSSLPQIAVDTNNNVHITWRDDRDGNFEIYYTKLDNKGNTLVDDTRLTTDSSHSRSPEIAVDTNNNVHITWHDDRDGNEEIYYTKLDNKGNTLVDDTRLTTDSASSWDPAIAVDTNNNVHITWQDERDGNGEIYYTKLDNKGNTLVDDTRLTTDSAYSAYPEIAVDTNNNVHITWWDDRDGNYEIYYKHSIAPTPTLEYFDTGEGTYPSIMGTHKGEIKPSCNINVSKLYTYPCAGTGGHTESIEIREDGELIASGTWSGYQSDYHNVSITPVILQAGHTYNYTIVTGSYPQIIHEPSKDVTGGTITCTSFVDANGKSYTDWIPAIRLWA